MVAAAAARLAEWRQIEAGLATVTPRSPVTDVGPVDPRTASPSELVRHLAELRGG